jgi:2-deoxy-D-gluconate 3-dehydrogenase
MEGRFPHVNLSLIKMEAAAMQSVHELFNLQGKCAIVTGGAMGIGQGIAFRLAEAGASVMIADVNTEAARKTAAEIKKRDGKAEAIRADASSISDAGKVAQAAMEAFGSLDILVNNAGIFPFSPALELTEALWQKVMDVNLKGAFFYAQAAARQMINFGRGGRIINIASIDALHPTGNLAHYDASKGGLVMLTKSLALEFAPYNILVNAIAPGSIRTPGAESQMVAAASAGISLEELSKTFMARLPLKRMGEPDDIAKVVLFFASAAADYITGSLLVVDGGYLLT